MKKIIVNLILLFSLLGMVVLFSSCGTDKNVNRAKLSGSKYWTNKAHPGKAYDVQVTDAVKVEGGKYRVKALVDGEQRVGLYDPDSENFDEGYYSAAYEKGKKVAEQDEELRYLKEKIEKLEKENYQMKLRLKYVQAGHGDPNAKVDSDTSVDDEHADVKPAKKRTPQSQPKENDDESADKSDE